MARWTMVIDLRRCIGCKACAVVCRAANRVPPQSWRRVIDCGVGGPPLRQRLFLPLCCNHCAAPPCLEVCPTKATYRRSDGIVDIDHKRCIGCGYCVQACPYRARTLEYQVPGFADEGQGPASGVDASGQERVGTCTKCNFCLPRVEAGLAHGLHPGVDPEATPACVLTCSAKALHFGDLDDPDSEVSRLIREHKTARLQEDLGTDPSVYYLIPEEWEGPPEAEARNP